MATRSFATRKNRCFSADILIFEKIRLCSTKHALSIPIFVLVTCVTHQIVLVTVITSSMRKAFGEGSSRYGQTSTMTPFFIGRWPRRCRWRAFAKDSRMMYSYLGEFTATDATDIVRSDL